MRSTLSKQTKKIYQFMASTAFLMISLTIFVLQALWLAISAWRLPYDEYYHLGIIKFYAGQWSPFVKAQPVETALYGDIIRLPSYMYHYLMSFPYRLLADITHNEVLIIFCLRLINIGLVVAAVLLFRKLFLEVGFSKRIINVSATIFLLTPMVVVLAAQSNYDNLILLLTPLFLLFAYRLMTGPITLEKVLPFLSIGMFGSIVKHSYLLIFIGTTLAVALSMLGRKSGAFRLMRVQQFFVISNKRLFTVICSLFVIVTVLFVERHVVNMVRYQQINVNCGAIHSREFCMKYSPWRRNENAKLLKQSNAVKPAYGNPASFGMHWVSTLSRGLFAVFANVPNTTETATDDPYGHYMFKRLLPVVTLTGYSGIVLGLVAMLLTMKRLWVQPFHRLIILVSASLLVTLFVFNYNTYLRIGQPFAIQVRYVFPLLLPMYLIALQAMGRYIHSRTLRTVVTSSVILLFLYSGGIVGWVVRSQPSWYIQNDTVRRMNESAQQFLSSVVIH